MNNEAREFLVKLDYPFEINEKFKQRIVFLRVPNDFKQIVDNISKEFDVDLEHLQAGDEFLVVFVKNQEEINKFITRYAHRISENGKFWFISNRYSLLNDENHFLPLINSQFKSTNSLIQIKNDYYAKLFQLKDNISNIANIEHYRTRKREAIREDANNEKRNSIRLSPKIKTKQIQKTNHLNIIQSGVLIKKKY